MQALVDALRTVRRRLWLLNRRRLQRRERRRELAYEPWCERYDTPDAAVVDHLARTAEQAGAATELTLVVDLTGVTPQALETTLLALLAQRHARWRLHLYGAADAAVEAWAVAATGRDPRLRRLPTRREAEATGDWLAQVEAGEHWRPHATAMLALAIARSGPATCLVYADHDRRDGAGTRSDPVFKCDWNPELLLSHDYLGTPALWRGDWLRARADGDAGAGRHGRSLAAGDGLTADQVVHVPHVLVHRDALAAALDADAEAVARQLQRHGVAAAAQATRFGVRVTWPLPDPLPLVSIIVPTRNGLHLLRRCIDSLTRLTRYPLFELIVVDNGSDDTACLRYLAELAASARTRVLRDDSPFNFSALNNRAAALAAGSVLLLLNNDIEVVEPGWLDEMVALALRPGVGAVGARLLYEDRTLQHGGITLGIHGGCGHGLRRLPPDDGGYLGRAQRLMTVSAVTAACLAVRRDHYESVGGLDEKDFAVAFNDVDFCLRLRDRGLRNVYTPHAVLLHHELATRGSDGVGERQQRFLREREAFRRRWGALLDADPAYSPNLSLDSESFALAAPPRVAIDGRTMAA